MCKEFALPASYEPALFSAIPESALSYATDDAEVDAPANAVIVPYLACGDLSGHAPPASVVESAVESPYDEFMPE